MGSCEDCRYLKISVSHPKLHSVGRIMSNHTHYPVSNWTLKDTSLNLLNKQIYYATNKIYCLNSEKKHSINHDNNIQYSGDSISGLSYTNSRLFRLSTGSKYVDSTLVTVLFLCQQQKVASHFGTLSVPTMLFNYVSQAHW